MKCTLCLYCAQVRRLKLELFVFFLVFLSHIPCMLHRYNSKHRVCERLFVRACVCVCVYCMPTPRARTHTHKQRTHTALNPTKLTDTESTHSHISASNQHKTRKTGGGNAHGATPKYQSNRALNQDEYGTASCKLDILVPDVRYSS